MGKLLSWLALFAIGWFVYKFVVISQRKSARPPAPGAPGPADAARGPVGEAMVPCAHCGVYLPASEALVSGADRFCCPAHRDAHVRP